MEADIAASIERKRHENEILQSEKDRKHAMFAWAARRRAAAAERTRREETATIREAGKEEKGRPRSNSAYGGRKSRTRRVQRRSRRSRR